MQIQVVILSQHSIFAEGIANRLRQYPREVVVHFIDPQDTDYLDEIKSIQPSAVILDAAAPTNAQCCLLCELLLAIPAVTIVRLEAEKEDVQIVQSRQQEMAKVLDILRVIKQS